MLLTTTPAIDGKSVREYRGIVTGEAIVGTNILKDIMAAVRDVVGGRTSAYEKALRSARQDALREMAHHAERDGEEQRRRHHPEDAPDRGLGFAVGSRGRVIAHAPVPPSTSTALVTS